MTPRPPHPRNRITQRRRLARIAEIIENVDRRCEVADGPVARTRDEITGDELKRIYRLAKGGAR